MKKYLVLIIIVIGVVSMCFFKKEKEVITSPITYMRFSYTTGYMVNSYVWYEVNVSDGEYVAKIKPNMKSEEEVYEVELSKEEVSSIEDMLKEFDVYKWDGFNESDQDVLDGNSFSCSIKYSDGKSISASGYMRYPKNYRDVRDFLDNLFMSKIE